MAQAHIVRAMMEAICFQTRDVLEAMQARSRCCRAAARWAWEAAVRLELIQRLLIQERSSCLRRTSITSAPSSCSPCLYSSAGGC